jgi:hypothetical protein
MTCLITLDMCLMSDDVHARVVIVMPASDVAHLWQVTWVKWENGADPYNLAVHVIRRILKDRAIYIDGMMHQSLTTCNVLLVIE